MRVEEIEVSRVQIVGESIRTRQRDELINDLSRSIDSVGILQPIIVQEQADCYRLVAGHRRLKAAELSNKTHIAAYILSKDISVRQVQLVENLQREDLNPLDRALAVRAFMEEANLSVTAVSRELGVPRTTINDWLDLLKVGEEYQKAVVDNYYGSGVSLTTSHISLVLRFSEKMQVQDLLTIILDAILVYELSRAETKRVLKNMEASRNFDVEAAIRRVRNSPAHKVEMPSAEEGWDAEKLVTMLARSGDYLVKSKREEIAKLSPKQKQELLRQSRALTRLLEDLMDTVAEGVPAKMRRIS